MEFKTREIELNPQTWKLHKSNGNMQSVAEYICTHPEFKERLSPESLDAIDLACQWTREAFELVRWEIDKLK